MGDQLDAAVFTAKLTRNFYAVVARRVVDDDNAYLLDALVQGALYAVAQELSVLEAWNGNIDARHVKPSAASTAGV